MPTNPLQFDLFDLAQPAGTHRPHTHRQPRSRPDPSNPTGYAQTIEEIADGSVTKSYTLGLDVISQAINDSGLTGTLRTLLYDGHGSVRQLVDAVGQVVKAALDSIGGAEVLKLDYNAYGQAINFAAITAVSSLLYSGEFTDATTGQQYLRARFYDPATGRFNRVDPFAGVVSEPQSLHKYLYGHGDPITNADPSGETPGFVIGIIAGAIGGAVGFDLISKVLGGSSSQRLTSAIYGGLGTLALGGMLGVGQFKRSVSVFAEAFIAGLMFAGIDWVADRQRLLGNQPPTGNVPPSDAKYFASFSKGFGISALTNSVDISARVPTWVEFVTPTMMPILSGVIDSIVNKTTIAWNDIIRDTISTVALAALTHDDTVTYIAAAKGVNLDDPQVAGKIAAYLGAASARFFSNIFIE